MNTHRTILGLRAEVLRFKRSGQSVAFVPTMGNLHSGHYRLVEIARERADRVVASVFVNPTQFAPNEDFERYPRTLEADAEGLARAGCDALFAPDSAEMYASEAGLAVVSVPALSNLLCGAFRPGHFDGVATVVAKLFNIVQPDFAIFGEKDYQQLAVIRAMVRGLSAPVEVVGAATVREPDGLAMSSRNQFLSPEERAVAALIFQTLGAIARRYRDGESVDSLESYGSAQLKQVGFNVDYVAVRDALTLGAVSADQAAVVLIAARIGSTRLIDSLKIELNA